MLRLTPQIPENSKSDRIDPSRLFTAALPQILIFTSGAARATTRVMVQNFETASSQPTVWTVNIPQETASVKLSAVEPGDGKQCLKLHDKFTGQGEFQYLGIPNKVKIQAPIHKLRFMIKGDKSGCSHGLQLTDASGETHQYKSGNIDYSGWKETTFHLDAPHETWSGDKNGKSTTLSRESR